jgi:hypothetical protein
MTALESIGTAQAHLGEAKQLLLQPTPAALDNCRAHFSEVVQILEELIAAGAGGLTPEVRNSVRQIQQAAQEVQAQIEHGSRFCLGFLQMRMGVGYNELGAPLMVESMTGSIPGYAEGRSFDL